MKGQNYQNIMVDGHFLKNLLIKYKYQQLLFTDLSTNIADFFSIFLFQSADL
jgi:hypothetical protein